MLFKALAKKLPKVTFSISSWIKDLQWSKSIQDSPCQIIKFLDFFKTQSKQSFLFSKISAVFIYWLKLDLFDLTSEKDCVDFGHWTFYEFITINDGVSVIRIESPQFIIIFKNYFLLLKSILFLEQMCHI